MVQAQEPSAKRRKVDGGAGDDSYPSDFQDLLEAENDQGGTRTLAHRALTGDSIETEDAWPRPALPKVNPATDTLGEHPICIDSLTKVFQQIEVAESSHPQFGPTLRLFGVTKSGNSMLAHVHGFRPYFYVAAPSGFLQSDLTPLKDTLNVSAEQGSRC